MSDKPEMGVKLVVDGADKFDAALKQADEQVKKSADNLKGQAVATKDAGDTAQEAGGKFGFLSNIFGEGGAASAVLTAGVAAVTAGVAAAAGAAVMAFNAFMEMNAAMAGVQARTGVTGDALQALRDDAVNLTRTGLTESFDDAARILERTRTQLDFISATSIPEFAREAAGVGKAWGTSGESVVDTVDGIMDKFNDMKGQPLEALNALTQAAQKSHIPLQTIQGIVERSGSAMAAAGLSAQDMFAMIARSGDIGVDQFRALTIGIDKLHQGFIKPPPGFQNALYQLGLGSVAYNLKNNKTTFDVALNSIYAKLGSIQDPAKADAIAMALFGQSIDKIGGSEAIAKFAGFAKSITDLSVTAPGLPANFRDMSRSIAETGDAASKVADVMEDDGTLGTAIKKAGANIKATFEQGAEWIFQQLRKIGGDDPFKNILTAAGDTASKIGGIIIAWIQAQAKPLQDAVSAWGESIAGGIGAIIPTINTALGNISIIIQAWVSDRATEFQNTVSAWGTSIAGGIANIGPAVSSAFDTVTAAISGWINDRIADFQAAVTSWAAGITGQVGEFVKAAQNLVDGVVRGIQSKINDVIKAAENMALQAALAVARILQSHSPSKVMVDIGYTIPQGLAKGIGDMVKLPARAASDMATAATESASTTLRANGSQSGAAFGRGMAQPMAAPMAVSSNSSSVSNRNMTVNMNGVRGSHDAVQRFATLNALKKV